MKERLVELSIYEFSFNDIIKFDFNVKE